MAVGVQFMLPRVQAFDAADIDHCQSLPPKAARRDMGLIGRSLWTAFLN
jgi:hypothetical protein